MRDTHERWNGKPPGKLHGTSANSRLREARVRRGWRQADVAAAVERLEDALAGGTLGGLGVDGDMVGRWERGEHHPGTFYQARLCLALGAGDRPEDIGFTAAPALLEEIRRLRERLRVEDAEAAGPAARISRIANEVDPASAALIVVFTSHGGSAAGGGVASSLPLTPEQLNAVQNLLQGDDGLRSPFHHFDASRRQMLQHLLSAAALAAVAPQALADSGGWDRLSHAVRLPAPGDAHEPLCQALSGAWALSDRGDLETSERIVTSILPRLVESASSSREGACLATHALRLLSILRAHALNFDAKIEMCRQAVGFARLSGDPTALTAAMTELAVAFKYAGQPDRSLATYQEAVSTCGDASPLVRSRVYAASAAAHARFGRAREALMYVDLAYEAFPERPGSDADDVFADSGIHMLAYYQGVMHLELGQPARADEAFEGYRVHPAAAVVPERNRLEILNQQARAAIGMRDLDRYVSHLEAGLGGAVAIGSRKRFDEAATLLRDDAPAAWRREPRIQQLCERFDVPQRRN